MESKVNLKKQIKYDTIFVSKKLNAWVIFTIKKLPYFRVDHHKYQSNKMSPQIKLYI